LKFLKMSIDKALSALSAKDRYSIEIKSVIMRSSERGTRRLKSIYHKLFMVLALKSSPHHLSLINNNS